MKRYTWIILSFLTLPVLAQSVASIISRGNDLYKQTRFEDAEKVYRQALQIEPGNTTAIYNLANALQKQKKYDEAAQLLETLYKNSSGRLKSQAAYNQGVAYTKLKNLDASIESYKNALRINPDDQEARENLQKALAEKKKQQQDQQQQQKPSSGMSQKEAEQKLDLLQNKEKQLQQKIQSQRRQPGAGGKDW